MLTRSFAASLLCGLFASTPHAQVTAFGHTWTSGNAAMHVITDSAGETLAIRNGMALAADAGFRDGTISFEMKGGRRHLAGVSFRAQGSADYEIIYFSADSARWQDAQYQPVFQGETTWQLYPDSLHTRDLTAAPGVDEWVRVRLEIRGKRARIWVNDGATPVLDIPDLKRDVTSGSVGVWSVVPNDSGPKSELLIRNWKVTSTTSSFKSPAPKAARVEAIRDWMISQRFAAFDTLGESDTLPYERVLQWKTAKVEPSGLINLTQQIGNPAGPQTHNVFGGAGWGMAFARTQLTVEKPETCTLQLGYSDVVSVFLDGKLIYKGSNAYGAAGKPKSGPYGLGRVQFGDATIPVQLSAGTHDLVLMIGDRAFGWGFKARWQPARADGQLQPERHRPAA